MDQVNQLHDNLRALRAELEAKRESVEAGIAPLRTQREEIVAKIQALEAELRPLNKQIQDAEKPSREIGQQLAEIARVLGAKSVRNG